MENIFASGSSDTYIKIWDVNTLKCIMTLKGHDGRIHDIKFSPDANWLASSSEDQKVIVKIFLIIFRFGIGIKI